MRVYKTDIVFQEIPGEISLAFYVCGCQVRCKGCHSPELWNDKNGSELTFADFQSLLKKYAGLVSCVLFMGGEWHEEELVQFFKSAAGVKKALYTGRTEISEQISQHLDYLKLGPWISELGGLTEKTTNQKLFKLPAWEQIFLNKGEQQDFLQL